MMPVSRYISLRYRIRLAAVLLACLWQSAAAAEDAFKPTTFHRQVEELARDIAYTGGRLRNEEQPKDWHLLPRGPLSSPPGDPANPVSRNPSALSIKGDKEFREKLNNQGYELLDSIDERGTDMQATVLREKEGGKTFIVFRGTEFDVGNSQQREIFIKDLVADVDDKGDIGRVQYEKNREKLAQWAQRYPGSIVTGHSLGSALAQQYIVDHPDAVSQAHLFNPPAIAADKALKFLKSPHKPEINFYVGKGDLASELGGQNHLLGNIIEVEKPGATFPESHSFYMFPEDGEKRNYQQQELADFQGRRIRSFNEWADSLGENQRSLLTGNLPRGPSLIIAATAKPATEKDFGKGEQIRSETDPDQYLNKNNPFRDAFGTSKSKDKTAKPADVEKPGKSKEQNRFVSAPDKSDDAMPKEPFIVASGFELHSGNVDEYDPAKPPVIDPGRVVVIVQHPNGDQEILDGVQAIAMMRRRGFLRADSFALTDQGRRGYEIAGPAKQSVAANAVSNTAAARPAVSSTQPVYRYWLIHMRSEWDIPNPEWDFENPEASDQRGLARMSNDPLLVADWGPTLANLRHHIEVTNDSPEYIENAFNNKYRPDDIKWLESHAATNISITLKILGPFEGPTAKAAFELASQERDQLWHRLGGYNVEYSRKRIQSRPDDFYRY